MAVIEMHIANNSYGMYLAEAVQRMTWYPPPQGGSYYTPWLWYDGNQHGSYDYANWQSRIVSRMNQTSPVTITMWGTYNPGTRSGTIYARYRNDGTFTINGNALFVLDEDSIYQPTPNGDQWHNHVARDYIPNYVGSSVSIPAGDSVTVSQPFTLQLGWNSNRCEIVTWIQNPVMQSDSTKEIWQGSIKKINQLPVPSYTLTVNISGNGSVTKTPNQTTYTYGTWVRLTAIPGTEYHFVNWNGDLNSTQNPDSIYMNGNKTVTANFAINTYSVTTNVSGSGTVNKVPNQPTYNYGTWVSLNAVPGLGWYFVNWTGDLTSSNNPDSIYVNTNKTVAGNFSINTYTITATAGLGGSILPAGTVIATYGSDTTFIITPNQGYRVDSVFVDGDYIGAVTQYTFTAINDDHTISATFALLPPGWMQKESMRTQVIGKYIKDGGALVAAGSDLFAFRGNKSNEFYMYVPGTKTTWELRESIPYGRKPNDPYTFNKKKVAKGASLAWDGGNYIYATKGNSTAEFWAYDINANNWIAKEFVPVTKAFKGGTSIVYKNEKVYLLAGGQKIGENNFFHYDIADNTWTIGPSLPATPNAKAWKDGSCLAVLDGTVYALKGGDKYNPLYSYNGSNWSAVDSIPVMDMLYGKSKKLTVKDGGAMTSGDGAVYAIKGGGVNVFWQYTAASGWTRIESIPRRDKKSVPKTGAALTYAKGIVYLLKGNSTLEFWQYVPTAEILNVKSQISNVIRNENADPNVCPILPTNVNVGQSFSFANKTIRYTVTIAGKVTIKLYNTTGRLVETLHDGYLNAGNYAMNISNISSGVYFLRYSTVTNQEELKLIVR